MTAPHVTIVTMAGRAHLGGMGSVQAIVDEKSTIVDGLGKLPSLSKVSLESSRSYEFRGKNAREYKVSFVADLEKRWRLPEIAVVAEAGESKP
jgi:UDP-N-acetylmuramyl pentapeptide synthase